MCPFGNAVTQTGRIVIMDVKLEMMWPILRKYRMYWTFNKATPSPPPKNDKVNTAPLIILLLTGL